MKTRRNAGERELQLLQRQTFDYFLKEVNPANGLILDKTAANWPASIAATGLALACYPVAVERGSMTRPDAVARTLTTLRFFWSSPQGPEPDATGHRGFYYHFLDMQTGRHVWQYELSTIDSDRLLAGALAAAAYFDAKAGPATLKLNGVQRQFYDYVARGVPYGPDGGTLAPWAVVVVSLPFAPQIVLEAIDFCIHQAKLTAFNRYGFKAAFNPTHPGEPGNPYGWWVSPWHLGLNQGPIVLMIENHHDAALLARENIQRVGQ